MSSRTVKLADAWGRRAGFKTAERAVGGSLVYIMADVSARFSRAAHVVCRTPTSELTPILQLWTQVLVPRAFAVYGRPSPESLYQLVASMPQLSTLKLLLDVAGAGQPDVRALLLGTSSSPAGTGLTFFAPHNQVWLVAP